MLKLNITLRYENVNKIRAIVDGEAKNLTPVSKIQLKIPSLGIVIEDSTPSSYPIKWEFSPVNVGLIELQIGKVQSLLDSFILSTTGNTTTDSQWITNIPAAYISKISKYMSLEGVLSNTILEILEIDRENNKIKISKAADATATGVSLSIYEMIKGSTHKCEFYIFNTDYPDGIFWNKVDLNISI